MEKVKIELELRKIEAVVLNIQYQLEQMTEYATQKIKTSYQTPLIQPLVFNYRQTPNLQTLKSNVFSLKRKTEAMYPSVKFAKLTQSSDSSQKESVGSDWDDLRYRLQPGGWTKNVKSVWRKAQALYSHQQVFQPTYTPNQTGFSCDLEKIFPESLRSYKEEDSVKWHNQLKYL